jgi:hypothetical protein
MMSLKENATELTGWKWRETEEEGTPRKRDNARRGTQLTTLNLLRKASARKLAERSQCKNFSLK